MSDTILAFPSRKEARVFFLMERAATALEALAEDVAELAVLRGSLDGVAMFGPLASHGVDDLDGYVWRPRSERRRS